VVGYLTECGEIATDGIDLDVPITYNPYKYDSFVDARCEVPVSSALFVNLNSKGKLHAYNVQSSH
jgi:hypothetical protein